MPPKVLSGGHGSSPTVFPTRRVDIVETALQVLVVLALVLMVAVALFNRSRMLVSPPLRDLPGAREEWRAQGAG